ncbi:MAG: DUF1592 domain-containing protein [Planctomycetota bacterium]
MKFHAFIAMTVCVAGNVTWLSAKEAVPIRDVMPFLQRHCSDCHGDGADAGGFELSTLTSRLDSEGSFDAWQLVHDRIESGEMPPADAERPDAEEISAALAPISLSLTSHQREFQSKFGRVTSRRLNAIQFETTLSDLFQTPLDIADLLPEDASEEGFSTVGSALNVSSVQMEAYLEAIDAAIDQSIRFIERPETQKFRLSLLNNLGYMQTYRMQHPTLPVVDGMNLYATEAMSNHHALWGHYVVPHTGRYRIKVSAYRVNTDDAIALTLRVGGNGHKESLTVKHRLLEHLEIASDQPEVHEWEGELLRGHFIHLYPSELPLYRFQKNKRYSQVKWTGPGVCVQWLEVEGPIIESWPPPGQEILFGGVRTESIPGAATEKLNQQLLGPPIIPADPRDIPRDWPPNGTRWKPLAGPTPEKAKFPAQVYSRQRGKVIDQILAGSHPPAKPLPDYRSPPFNLPNGSPLPTYGGEPIYMNARQPGPVARTVRLSPDDAKADAARLIRRILPKAFRRPVSPEESARFVGFVHDWLDRGVSFESAMRTGYKAIFTSPQFLFHQSSLPQIDSTAETPTRHEVHVGSFGLAERLAYFLSCSSPDLELLRVASRGELTDPQVLRDQTERLLRDPRLDRFVADFLGQWLDLHEIEFTSPDKSLYPEYDAVLHSSMLMESHSFFRHLIENDLSCGNLIDSDFITVNRRLARHYGIDGISGMTPTVVQLPNDSVRGGVMTQAAVLKVTANGTNTSPVVRGVWVLERLLGSPPPPPPPGIPAVEPDIRGAVTIREQLEKHRGDSECASCHAKIDPPGIALESFDPVGRYRQRYRVLDPAKVELRKQDHSLRYNEGLAVDPSYQLPSGGSFRDIRELKMILAKDQQSIAQTLADRLLIYSTGATTSFADRKAIEAIAQQTESAGYGVRSIIHAVVQSELFRQR